MAETDARFLEILNEEIQEYEGYENGMVVRDLLGQRDSYAIDHGEREDTEPLSDTQIETLKKIIEDVKGTATARWEAEKARATYST